MSNVCLRVSALNSVSTVRCLVFVAVVLCVMIVLQDFRISL